MVDSLSPFVLAHPLCRVDYLKLARCSLSATQLDRVFGAALRKRSGFEAGDKGKGKGGEDHVPTHADIMLSTNLLCLSLNLSDNALGAKGAEVVCAALAALKQEARENYTLVSLNLARNSVGIAAVAKLVVAMTGLACLERLCVSENVRHRQEDGQGERHRPRAAGAVPARAHAQRAGWSSGWSPSCSRSTR